MSKLDWKAGIRRAGFFFLLYILIFYTMSVVWPERFGLGDERLAALVIQGVIFFFLLTLLFAWSEPRRKARMAELQARRQGKQPKPEAEDSEPSPYKGKPNPNTSRKKSRRRR